MQIKDRILKSESIRWKDLKFLQSDKFKKFPRELKAKLRESIIKNSFVQSFKVWESEGQIYCLDGFHRCIVMRELEAEGWNVPETFRADFLDCKDRKEAARLVIIYSASYTRITDEGMSEFIASYNLNVSELKHQINIPEYNFDLMERAVIKANEPDDKFDAGFIPEKPISKLGDLFEMNQHRLMCGDSTNKNDFDTLMNGRKARLIFTDPPYGVAYKNAAGDSIKNDALVKDKLIEFLYLMFSNLYNHSNDDVAMYCFYASIHHIEFEQAMIQAGFRAKEQIIWSKQFALSRADYHWSHEPAFYAVKQGFNCKWFGDRKERTVNELTSSEISKLSKNELVDIVQALKETQSVWSIDKDKLSYYNHPTQKPIALSIKALLNNSKFGDTVVDPFSGSASTLMGCEATQRQACVMELDERFVDLGVKRWLIHRAAVGGGYSIKKNGKEMDQEEIEKYLMLKTKKMSDTEKESINHIDKKKK